MAILNTIKFVKMRFKTLAGYIKFALTSDSVIMENGKDLQTEINAINSNLISVQMNIIELNSQYVSVNRGSFYVQFGKLVFVSLSFTRKTNFPINANNPIEICSGLPTAINEQPLFYQCVISGEKSALGYSYVKENGIYAAADKDSVTNYSNKIFGMYVSN